MSLFTYIVVFCAIWFVCGLRIGYVHGYRKGQRKVDLNAVPTLQAFAYYQARERYRHLCDIKGIDKDLRRMKELGIVPPDVPLNVWVNIKGGNER